MNRYLILAVFLIAVVGGGMAIGIYTAPGEWYAALARPSFNPPNWIFAPVWTVLYVIIAVVGWRTWMRRPRGTTMSLWWVQMALNFAWSPTFFGLHMIGVALVIIFALLCVILAIIYVSRKADPTNSVLFAPYAAWVGFATLLNGAIAWLN